MVATLSHFGSIEMTLREQERGGEDKQTPRQAFNERIVSYLGSINSGFCAFEKAGISPVKRDTEYEVAKKVKYCKDFQDQFPAILNLDRVAEAAKAVNDIPALQEMLRLRNALRAYVVASCNSYAVAHASEISGTATAASSQ
jgi:hypothetical protein